MNLKLSEPTTSITDFLLAAELFILGFLLFRAQTGQLSVHLWGTGFLFLGLSALSGGLFHGYKPHLSFWRITGVCILLTLAFFIAGGIISSSGSLALLVVCEIPLLLLMIRIAKQNRPSIKVKQSQLRIGIFFVALSVLLAYQMYAGGPLVGRWILAGSLIVFAGLWIQQSEWSIHKHFNHNDLCHVLFMIGMYFIYRGGLLLRDQSSI
ncbi:hypothetical protein L0222_21440 [bacterium]|nr:hypothetical protein [bacterium]MCI0607180.1 hypothetical protein [bacterium]